MHIEQGCHGLMQASVPTSGPGPTSGPSPISGPASPPATSPISGRKSGLSPTSAPASGPSPTSEPVSGPTALTPSEAPSSSSSSSSKKKWCVPKGDASEAALQANIDFVCKSSGIECGAIDDGGKCFKPNTVRSHAAYAMNAYYQASGGNDLDCDFNNTGLITYTDRSKFYYSTLDMHGAVLCCVLLEFFVLICWNEKKCCVCGWQVPRNVSLQMRLLG